MRSDKTLLGRVLRNLIENALRHTPHGGTVGIDVEPGRDRSLGLVEDGLELRRQDGRGKQPLALLIIRIALLEEDHGVGVEDEAGLAPICRRLGADIVGAVLEADETSSESRTLGAYLEQRLAFEHLIAAISTDFINAQGNLDSMIEAALGRIGSLFEVDRAYVFRFDAGPAAMSNTHEWVAEGVSREAHNLQQVPVDTFPWLMAELVQGRDVHVPDTARLPDSAASERSEFLREGIRSLAVVPFGNAGAPEGFIGFDCVRQYREWSPEIMIGLRLVGQTAFRMGDHRPLHTEVLARLEDAAGREMDAARERLIEKGVIEPVGHGLVRFTLPGFGAYVRGRGD